MSHQVHKKFKKLGNVKVHHEHLMQDSNVSLNSVFNKH